MAGNKKARIPVQRVCGPSRDYEVLAATSASSDTRPTQSIDGKTTTESRVRKQHAWQITGNGQTGQINYINADKRFRRTFLEKRSLDAADQCSYCPQHEIVFRHVLLSRRFSGGRTFAGAARDVTGKKSVVLAKGLLARRIGAQALSLFHTTLGRASDRPLFPADFLSAIRRKDLPAATEAREKSLSKSGFDG